MDNFKDTAHRMHKDVQILHDNSRWFNCCYLSGYVVECYCKLILNNAITNGIITEKSSVRDYSHNVRYMSKDLRNVSIAGGKVSKHCIDLNILCSNIMREWSPFNRYTGDNSGWNNEKKADLFKKEINVVIEQIITMELDGVI